MSIDDAALSAMAEPTPSDAELAQSPDPVLAPPDAPAEPPAAEAPAASAEPTPPPAADPPKPAAANLIARHRYHYQKQQRELAERRAAALAAQAQTLEAQIAELRAQQQPTTLHEVEQQITALDLKIEDARADGDAKQVAALRAQQRQLERSLIAQSYQQPAMPRVDERQIIQRAADSLRLEDTITRLERDYPMLEEGSEGFDADLSEEVMTLYDSLVAKQPPAQAMENAVRYVTRAHDIAPVSTPSARKTAVARNVRAAQSQPPELVKVGYDSAQGGPTQTLDVMKMTQEEFEALSDAEITRMLLSTAA